MIAGSVPIRRQAKFLSTPGGIVVVVVVLDVVVVVAVATAALSLAIGSPGWVARNTTESPRRRSAKTQPTRPMGSEPWLRRRRLISSPSASDRRRRSPPPAQGPRWRGSRRRGGPAGWLPPRVPPPVVRPGR